MRRWVKKELKKDPLRSAFFSILKYIREHRKGAAVSAAALLLLAGLSVVVIRDVMRQRNEAARLFSAAQTEFSRFNYDRSAQLCREILDSYPRSGISDHALYLKGLSYYKMEELGKADEALSEASERYSGSEIAPEIILSRGNLLEEKNDYENAIRYYRKVPDRHYLKPEALAGEARALELTGRKSRAVEIYRRISARHPDTYWAEFAGGRLEDLDTSREEPEVVPEIITE